jgi:NitT/TauT family transport system ATP-binding protein
LTRSPSAGAPYDLNSVVDSAKLVELKEVGVRFGARPVLAGVDLSIRSGEFVSLVGSSGCGKSTLLRVIAGLLAPSSGEAELAYRQRGGTSPIGYVFQAPTLLPWRTALTNVLLALELGGPTPRDARDRAAEALSLARLEPADFEKLPHQLSGGMQMRVSLARAIVTRPRLLLLDEPFAALDDLLRQQLNEELLALWSELGLAAVLVTHNIAEAVFVSQRVLLLAGSPATVADEVPVNFGYPRLADLRGTADFAGLTSDILARLRARAA